MAAELSIAIKIGAVLGGTLAAIGSVLGGTRNLASSVSILQRQYDVLGRAIRRASASGSADLARLQRQQAELGQTLNRMNRRHTQWQAIQTRLELGRDAREKLRSEAMSVIAGVGATLLPIKVAMDFESSMADVRKVVAFDTLQSAKANGADVVIIDTAGRLHNKIGLMNELKKIKDVMKKVVPEAPHEVLLVLDGSTGQNAFEQARQFAAVTQITSLAITKLDGTAKGGVVIGISDQLKVPVKYIGLGEGMEDLQLFDKVQFVDSLFK